MRLIMRLLLAHEHSDRINRTGYRTVPQVDGHEGYAAGTPPPDGWRAEAPHPRPRIIVVRFGNRRAGLVVDRVHGKCQTVIKPLGPLFAAVPAVSGSSIIGNGDVGLILDIPALIRQALDIRRAGQARTSHPQSILAGELS